MGINTEKEPEKLVAVVVAHSNQAYITPAEEISLQHLNYFLGNTTSTC